MSFSLAECLAWCVLAACAGIVLGRVWVELGQLLRAMWPRRPCQVYCPYCRQDLVSGDSTCSDCPDGLVSYTCSECNVRSLWDFDLPVPVLRGFSAPRSLD